MTQDAEQHAYPKLVLIASVAALVGCASALVTDIVGIIVVDGYNPISETISDLAAGPYAWIQDIGLEIFAVGIVACAVGMYFWNLDGWRWKGGSALLALVGVDIFIIAARNEYGDGDFTGVEIHIYLVYFLGVGFALATWLFASGLRRLGERWRWFSLGTTIAWAITAPFFLLAPTSWDGGYERLVGLILIVWLVVVSWLMLKHREKKDLLREI